MIPYCIAAIEDDDDRAFMENLYVTYNRLMYSELRKRLQNAWDAEDAMQTLLSRLIDRIPDLRSKSRDHLVNYIISACRNTAYNFMREHSRKPHVSLDDCVPGPASYSSVHEMELPMIRAEEFKRLQRIWPKLDDHSRYFLNCHYILEMSTKEIAGELGIKQSSVRMGLTRARQKAFVLLQEDIAENP